MGVPSLFRWFEKKFPGVVRKPDPKLDTCDNLYIDANSIIHNVCHPGHRPPPSTEEQMMVEIEAYITHVIKTAQPKKLVFIAIDGVAPQAKISQQRTRRFRAAKEASEIKGKKAQFIKAAREQGITRYNRLAGGDDWDSNAITPGTPFMAKLDAHLQAWILRKPKTDPYFVPLTIILSGSAVPGEGEHKAMDFIRRQRCQPGYKPLKHAFYGPDADLILLALATHEPSFRILREDPREKHEMRCIICQAYGAHSYKNCPAIPEDWSMPHIKDTEEFVPPRLIFFDVWLLRIALETYLKLPGSVDIKLEDGGIKKQALYNHERSIDDFILILALMGNDFIPHLPLPGWDISQGAINTAVDAWRMSTINQKGYITKNGKIRLDRLENLLQTLAAEEGFPTDPIDEEARFPSLAPKKDSATPDLRGSSVVSTSARHPDSHLWARHSSTIGDLSRYNTNEKLELPEGFPALAETSKVKSRESMGPGNLFQEYVEKEEDDAVVLEMFATKSSYYVKKLGEQGKQPETIRRMVRKYIEGLHWVMEYYCQGCPSWKWFYPFHYAPWPSDCVHLTEMKIEFKMSSPLPPFSQLMSVFPPSSSEHVPEPYRRFMESPDSVLKDYYPLDFKTDRNGKLQEWKSVVLLAHIDPARLQKTLEPVWEDRKLWQDSERMRNRSDVARVYVSDQGATKNTFQKLYRLQYDPRLKEGKFTEITYAETGCFAGKVAKDLKAAAFESVNQDFDNRPENGQASNGDKLIRTISAIYAVPHQTTPHSYELLPDQPEMHFAYRLVARMKRDPMRLAVREWPKGDNAGRDARAVADEIATGIRPEFVDWTASLRSEQDDEEDERFEELPHGFDDFIMPTFPTENEAYRLFESLNIDEAEDDEDRSDLRVQAGEEARVRSSNPFNRTTTLPGKRSREAAQTRLTAGGYTMIQEPKVKEEDDMSEDDDDSSEDEDAKKKRRAMFKKKKPAQFNGTSQAAGTSQVPGASRSNGTSHPNGTLQILGSSQRNGTPQANGKLREFSVKREYSDEDY